MGDPQKSGLRVIDAVAWAREVIEQGEGAPPTALTTSRENPFGGLFMKPRDLVGSREVCRGSTG